MNDDNNKKVWDWNKQNFYNHGYLKVDFLNGANNNTFLKYNSSQLYELDDYTGISKFGYICEAQGSILFFKRFLSQVYLTLVF